MTDATRMSPLPPLPRLMVEPIVRAALLGGSRPGRRPHHRQHRPGRGPVLRRHRRPPVRVVAGTLTALLAFELLDPAIRVRILRPDGSAIAPGEAVIALDGPARAILSAERVALNLLCRLSGVATATASLVEAAQPYGKARIVCTRKTTPGLRSLEKHAVRAGGGANHRFGLDDAVLIKDNHVAVAGGVGPAIRRPARASGTS